MSVFMVNEPILAQAFRKKMELWAYGPGFTKLVILYT